MSMFVRVRCLHVSACMRVHVSPLELHKAPKDSENPEHVDYTKRFIVGRTCNTANVRSNKGVYSHKIL